MWGLSHKKNQSLELKVWNFGWTHTQLINKSFYILTL